MTDEEKKEKKREYDRKRHAANREKKLERKRKHYAENREKELERQRKYHTANPEKNREWAAANPEKYTTKSLFYGARARAKAKGLPFTLTKEWVAERIERGICELSGVPFNIEAKRGVQGPYSPSIDKIVPELGYTPENSRMVLYGINALKSNGTNEDMINIMETTIKYIRGDS